MLACKYSKEWKSFCLIAVCLYLLCIDYIKNHVRKYQAFRPGTRSPLSRYGFIYIYIYVILVHTTHRHIYTHLRIAIMLLFATFPEKYIYTPDFHIEIIIANKNNTHIYIPSQIRAKRAHRRKFIAALKIVCLCILCVSFRHYLASHHIINVMKAHTEYGYKYITTHTRIYSFIPHHFNNNIDQLRWGNTVSVLIFIQRSWVGSFEYVMHWISPRSPTSFNVASQ